MTLRVLHCIYDDPGNPWVAGGGAVRARELYRRLAGTVSATVASGNYPGASSGVLDGVCYQRLGSPSPYAWSRFTYAGSANLLLRRGDYDVAVFDFSTYTPIFVPRSKPVGVTVHHVSGPTASARWGPIIAPAVEQLEKAMIGRACRLSATSLATRELLRVIAPDKPIDMVYAGVPDELFELERQPEDYLLYFGRIDIFQKGLDTLVDALTLLVRDRPGLLLRVAGRGNDANRLAAMFRDGGLEKNVELLGAVSEAERRRLFAGAAVQVMPSRFEGFGMVAAEAMAAGVPLVAASSGSLPEVVDAPQGGVLVPPGDPAALARAVVTLLEAPEARRALSESARLSAERFRWSNVAADHLAFLQRIAESRQQI